MTAATEPQPRIASLDVVRGFAVMGILAMNVVAFAMPFPAYMNPAAYGGHTDVDLISWLASTVLIDGKMRGLFSILFGASTLLVIEKAASSGRGSARTHYARMIVLLLIGLAHFYLIWFGDILSLYAMCGMLLYAFRNLPVRKLVGWAISFLTVSFIIFSMIALTVTTARAPGLPAETRQGLAEASRQVEKEVGANSPRIESDLALYRGPWLGVVEHRVEKEPYFPFLSALNFGWETMGLMLIGMALFRSGFLTGALDDRRYRNWAAWCFGIGIPGAAALGLWQIRSGFDVAVVMGSALGWSMPFDVLLAIGWAALVILWAKRGNSALRQRVAAAGRMAFTNYLATSLVMTFLFYGWGLGLFGSMSRAQLWLPVLGMWLLMLAWSKPWLDRFEYGPMEWLWRSLARLEVQPIRRQLPA